jgi:Mycothiol maleylpyruvate isomerase N-terminal domain
MSDDRSFVEENARELERMRVLVERLREDELRRQVNPHWTVAGVLGHIAFWDARILALAGKLESGVPFSESDTEPEDVDWINDSSRPFIHAVEPGSLARLALEIAGETDRKVASLPAERLYPADPESPMYAFRSSHRGEHLDDIESALKG